VCPEWGCWADAEFDGRDGADNEAGEQKQDDLYRED
jgi:hypothetical protein